MSRTARWSWLTRRALMVPVALMSALILVLVASPALPVHAAGLVQISRDPYLNESSQHATQVEPDTFAFGSTIVSAFQSGRFTTGGASNIGWATSTDGGGTWAGGFLKDITVFEQGPYDRVSDPAVAYDAKHGVWMISSLPLLENPTVHGAAVVVNRSADGLDWDLHPLVTTATGNDLDKNWTVCDNTLTSSFYGNCYTEWDNHAAGNLIQMSVSSDGGLTWSPPRTTAERAAGLGGQPLVQADGKVIVPIDNAFETAIGAFTSTDGGETWSTVTTISVIRSHRAAGTLRAPPLPTAEIAGDGMVFVVWADCRFETLCSSNDLVLSTSTDGTTWSDVTLIPIDIGADHFIPGLAVDRDTAGKTAHLVLAFYYYTNAVCSPTTCELNVGYVSSSDGGGLWSAGTQLAGPMTNTWLAFTAGAANGYMVGDYISTSFTKGLAYPVIAVANPPVKGVFDEAMYSVAAGLSGPGAGSAPHGAQSAGGNVSWGVTTNSDQSTAR